MNVSIRKAVIEDLPTLLQINDTSVVFNASYDPFIDMNWIHTEAAKKIFSDAITKKGHLALVAVADSKQVGFLLLGPRKFPHRKIKLIELDILAVLPTYRSKGIGTLLVKEARRWAKNNNYQVIYAVSYSKNERAIAFYKREGFLPIDLGLELIL